MSFFRLHILGLDANWAQPQKGSDQIFFCIWAKYLTKLFLAEIKNIEVFPPEPSFMLVLRLGIIQIAKSEIRLGWMGDLSKGQLILKYPFGVL